MGKRLLNLYVEDSLVELAKAKRINLSALFRSMMEVEVNLKEGSELSELKATAARLTEEVNKLREENARLTAKVARGGKRAYEVQLGK